MEFNEFEKWTEQEVKAYNDKSMKNNDIEFKKYPTLPGQESICFEISLCKNHIFGNRGGYIFYNSPLGIDIRYSHTAFEEQGLSGITLFFEIKRGTTIEKAQQFIKGLL